MLNLTAVRAWATENGTPAGKRGRLPRTVIAAYLVANPRTAREVASLVGVTVGKRGRISPVAADAIAAKV